jgi:hypothetical protein
MGFNLNFMKITALFPTPEQRLQPKLAKEKIHVEAYMG